VGRYDTKYLLEQGYEKELRASNYSMLCNCEQAVKNSWKNDQAIIIVDAKNLRYSRVAHLKSNKIIANKFLHCGICKFI